MQKSPTTVEAVCSILHEKEIPQEGRSGDYGEKANVNATNEEHTLSAAEDELRWVVWPCRKTPLLSLAVALLVLGLSAGAMISFGSGWYAFIVLAVLTVALAPHYFPTTYILGPHGVHIRTPFTRIERSWESFRAIYCYEQMMVLSPVSDPNSGLTRRRGVVLRLGDNPEAVEQFVRAHVNCTQTEDEGVD